jgi:hypothetical protein
MPTDKYIAGNRISTADPLPVEDAPLATAMASAGLTFGAPADAMATVGGTGSLSAKLRRLTQGVEDLKTTIILAAGTALLGKVGIDQTIKGSTNAVYSAPAPQTPTSYRTAVVAADVLAVPGTVTCTKINGVGALAANTYYVKVVALNAFGRTTGKAGDVTVTTETTNLCVKAAFAAVAGATHYDIYCSIAADPLFTGRITEAQRASGGIITAHNTFGAGGAVDSVYIYVTGTGLAAGVSAAANTAYVVPASPVNCAGYTYADFDLTCSRTGDDVAPALTVAPMLWNARTATYSQGQAVTLSFGGPTGLFGSMCQRVRVEVRGNSAVALLVQSIAGTGMSANIDVTLS